jgi:3-hydroxyacyl-CoA dehydrogenase
MVERGDATAEDVDQAMQLGAGYRKSELDPKLMA